MVNHCEFPKSVGILVANGDDFVTVLWTVTPGDTLAEKMAAELAADIDADIMRDLLAMGHIK